MAYASGWSSIVELQNGQVVSDAYDNAFANIDFALGEIDVMLNGAGYEYIQYILNTTPPSVLAEGMMYYDQPSHSFVAIDDIVGTKLNLGHELDERAYNISGQVILEGKVVAVGGQDANDVIEITLANASLLATAVAFGISTSEFAVGGIGKVVKLGRVHGVDTAGVGVNGLLYLDDAVAGGGLTGTPPEITTVVGYVIEEQSGVGVADGTIYVEPRSIISLPNVVAYMNQNTATSSITLSTTPIVIDNFNSGLSGGIIMPYFPSTGIITAPANGIYDMTIDFATNYDGVGQNVLHLLVQIMGDNGVDAPYEVGRYNKELGKSSTSTNGSMTKTFSGEKDISYYMQMSAPDIDLDLFVLENVSFSLKSIDIR